MKYKTINSNSVFEETEKRSQFITYSFFVSSIKEVREQFKRTKAMHPYAKHHVYAYLLRENFVERYSDDGEPSGTAGLPLLSAIKSFELVNVMVVTARYFGGILLGTNGLRKMYLSGARQVLEMSGTSYMVLCSEIFICCDYKNYNKVVDVLSFFKGKIKSTDYSDKINILSVIPSENKKAVSEKLFDILHGTENIKIGFENYEIIRN